MRVVSTYDKDGRLSYKELNDRFNLLLKAGWKRKLIYKISGRDYGGKKVLLRSYAYMSPNLTRRYGCKTFWILSGIHGEEPAGPNAIAENVALISNLAKSGIPIILMPLLNPLGYIRDYRYYNSRRHKHNKIMHSVGDADHLLPSLKNPANPRREKATNRYAEQVLSWVQLTATEHPPLVVFDHHEDEIEYSGNTNITSGYTYSYCYGKKSDIKDISKLVTNLLVRKGFPIQKDGLTSFDERITEGFVFNSKDGSIDEYLFYRGAKACFVVETTRDDQKPIPLESRKQVHAEIIGNYRKIWSLLK